MRRTLLTLLTLSAAASMACSSLPTVVSSMDEAVAVEFDPDDGVASATPLAEKECARYGRAAKFDKVDMTATPDSRIARFNCIDDK